MKSLTFPELSLARIEINYLIKMISHMKIMTLNRKNPISDFVGKLRDKNGETE